MSMSENHPPLRMEPNSQTAVSKSGGGTGIGELPLEHNSESVELEALKMQVKGFAGKLERAVEERTAEMAAHAAELLSKLTAAEHLVSSAEADARRVAVERDAERAQHELTLIQKLHAAEQAFERRLGIMETKLSEGMKNEATRRVAAEEQLQKEQQQRHSDAATAAADQAVAVAAAASDKELQLAAEKERRESAELELTALKTSWMAEKAALETAAVAEVEAARKESEVVLSTERSTVQRLRGEVVVLRQRYEDTKNDAEKSKTTAQEKSSNVKKLATVVEGLHGDLAGLRAELARSETALREKESLLREYIARESATENKCVAMTEACAAAEKEVAAKGAAEAAFLRRIEELRKECRSAGEKLAAAELAASSRKQREAAARKEGAAYHQQVEACKRRQKKIARDIADAAAVIQSPGELKAAVVKLYQTYCVGGGAMGEEAENFEEEREGKRGGSNGSEEEKMLRTTIERLQKQLRVQQETNAAEKRRAVLENSLLLKELRKVEEEVKFH